jgi:5-methyltetrahydrofolate--homocysteine methyltransferase
MSLLEQIATHLENGDADQVVQLVDQAIEADISASQILNEGLIAGMNVVGRKFREGEIFIPEVLIAARAMSKGIERLEPLLLKSGVKARGKLLIGTVQDDLHDIGKNLVAIMFKGAGFEVIDLGVNVPPEKFVAEAAQHKPDVIGLSALLTTTMLNMEKTIKTLRNNGCQALIIVGGAPVSEEFAQSISADLYARNAVEGVDKVLARLN